MLTRFQRVLDVTLRWEGGFVNHPRDPGGATNMGITIGTLAAHRGRAVTVQEVRDLTKAEAGEIYRKRFWAPVRGDDLPAGIDLVTFDAGVNAGPRRGAEWTQRALGVEADGRVGPVTVAAARSASDPVAVIRDACARRLGFKRRLAIWDTFGRGWSNRVADVEARAVAMAVAARGAPVRQVLEAERQQAVGAAQREEAGAAVPVGGGAGLGLLADLPTWGLVALGVGVVVAVVLFLGGRRHELARAEAYRRAAEEAGA